MDALIENIRYEEFISALQYHIPNPHIGLLPPEGYLRDFRIQANIVPKPNQAEVPISFFFVQEYDPLLSGYKSFAILRSIQQQEKLLIREAKRLRNWFKIHNWHFLFRIDPIYGLYFGSVHEPIQPELAKPSPHVLITSVLTEDPGHPEVSMLEYIPSEKRKQYIKIFEEYNKVRPGTFKLLGFDFGKFFKKKAEEVPKSFKIWEYTMLQDFLKTLLTQHYWIGMKISLIYSNVQEEDFRNIPFPSSALTFFPNPPHRFFDNIEELLHEEAA